MTGYFFFFWWGKIKKKNKLLKTMNRLSGRENSNPLHYSFFFFFNVHNRVLLSLNARWLCSNAVFHFCYFTGLSLFFFFFLIFIFTTPLFLKNPMDRGACRPRVHGVTKSWTWLSMHVFMNRLNEPPKRKAFDWIIKQSSISNCYMKYIFLWKF